MKKSFMTRALAMGLSVAMAFSLSAATNVSVASAAATPAMASKQFAVRVGGAAKSYKASTATQKSFKITKATVGNTDKATVSINSSKKSIKVTPGTVTGTTVVKVTFKNNKTKKSTTKSYRCVVKAEVKQDPAITSAKQTGVKAIVVETNFDVEAAQSKVSVKRGSNDVATDKISYSDDGKTITINTTANIVAADYTVYVGDLSEVVKGEVSKVDKIEVLGDKAAAVKVGSDYKKATVGYMVTNQFGDDITKTTSLTVNSSAAGGAQLSSKDHMITFDAGASVFMINRDIITVTLLDTTSGKSANANLTVSMEAYAKELTFEGVYNSEKKTLTEDTDTGMDNFYLLFSAVDQYGNKFKNYKGVVEGEDLFLSVMGGMTTLDKVSSTKSPFTVITKDDKDYLAYRVVFKNTGMDPVNGEASIQLLSTGGTSCTGTVTVAEGTRVTAITVNSPGVIAAGEKTNLDFVATDASGKEVTAYKILRHVDISDNAVFPVTWVKNTNGTGKLVLDASDDTLGKNQTSMQTYTFTTQGKKFYHSQLTITENARPVALDGLKDVDTTISSKTGYVSIKLKNLKIEDQYGRIMSNDALKDAVVKGSGIYNLSAVAVRLPYAQNIVYLDDFYTGFNARTTADTEICKIKTTGRKGDATVEFQIYNGITDSKSQDYLNDASADVLFTVKDTSEVEAATATVDNIYVPTNAQFPNAATDGVAKAYAQTVTVKAGGAQLTSDDYHVSVPSDMGFFEDRSGATPVYKIYSLKNQDAFTEFKNNTADTVTRKIKITLNGTGDSFTTDVTLCKTAPYVNKVSLASDTFAVGTTGAIVKTNVYDKCFSELKDQYGKKLVISDVNDLKYATGDTCTPNVTFTFKTDDSQGSSVIYRNGRTDADLIVGADFVACTMTVAFNGNIDDKTVAEINLVNKFGDVSALSPIQSYNTIGATVTGDAVIAIINGSKQLQLGTSWSDLEYIDKLKVAEKLSNGGATTQTTVTGAAAQIQPIVSKAALARVALVSDAGIITAVTKGGVSASALNTSSGALATITTTLNVPASTSGGGIIALDVNDVEFNDSVLTASNPSAVAYFDVSYAYASDSYLDCVVTYKVEATRATDGTVTYKITKVDEYLA